MWTGPWQGPPTPAPDGHEVITTYRTGIRATESGEGQTTTLAEVHLPIEGWGHLERPHLPTVESPDVVAPGLHEAFAGPEAESLLEEVDPRRPAVATTWLGCHVATGDEHQHQRQDDNDDPLGHSARS